MLAEYLWEFEAAHEAATRHLDAADAATDGKPFADESALVASEIRKMKDALLGVELEIRSLGPAARTEEEIEQRRRKRLMEQSSRRWLEQSEKRTGDLPPDFKNKAALVTEKLHRTNRTAQETYKVAAETEQMGERILLDLHRQRQVIEKTQSTSNSLSQDLDASASTLQKIDTWWNRMFKQ